MRPTNLLNEEFDEEQNMPMTTFETCGTWGDLIYIIYRETPHAPLPPVDFRLMIVNPEDYGKIEDSFAYNLGYIKIQMKNRQKQAG